MADYRSIATDLRARIARNEFPVGSDLPGTPDLMRHYDAALHTVRRAQRELRDEGLILTQQGYPTKVIKQPTAGELPTSELLAKVKSTLREHAQAVAELEARLTSD